MLEKHRALHAAFKCKHILPVKIITVLKYSTGVFWHKTDRCRSVLGPDFQNFLGKSYENLKKFWKSGHWTVSLKQDTGETILSRSVLYLYTVQQVNWQSHRVISTPRRREFSAQWKSVVTGWAVALTRLTYLGQWRHVTKYSWLCAIAALRCWPLAVVIKKIKWYHKTYYFGVFLQILSQLKTFSKNRSARIILLLNATFMPNLTFLGLLGAEISFREKTVSPQTPKHPAYLAIREPYRSAPHWGITQW